MTRFDARLRKLEHRKPVDDDRNNIVIRWCDDTGHCVKVTQPEAGPVDYRRSLTDAPVQPGAVE